MINADDLPPFPMTPVDPQHKIPSSPSEAWDDDFVFSPPDGNARKVSTGDGSPKHEKKPTSRTQRAGKVSPRTPQRTVAEGLRAWSESPTSPRTQAVLGPKNRQEERENWDDDFLDSTDSPARPAASNLAASQSRFTQRSKAREELEDENWDEDFVMGIGTSSPRAGPSTRSKRSRRERERDEVWDSSDDEMAEFDREMGFDRNDEEDKTVTSRSRRKPLGSLVDNPPPLPPLPPLPTFLPTIPSGDASGSYASPPSPFPRSSPSHSVFSIPATTTSGGHRDRDSTYGSTAHLALSLRRTHSAESSPSSPRKFVDVSRFPSSEAPRERRRLRKKSRPPHLDASILELDDKVTGEPAFLRSSTPDPRPSTPPPTDSGLILSPTTPSTSGQVASPAVPLSPISASKSPLLARIGSLRRWGRKRTSASASVELNPLENTANAAGSSPTSRVPPSSFSTGIFDPEAERLDHNRTPRPRSHAGIQPPPPSTMPPPPTIPNRNPTNIGHPQTPSRNRFFRGSSGGMETDTTTSGRPSLAIEVQSVNRSKSKEREQEKLRVAIPAAVPMTTQSSQSGESEVGIAGSPRRARIRAFGQKLLASKRSVSASSHDRAVDSSDGDSSQVSARAPGSHQVLTPLSGDTPTRLRPRIPSMQRGLASHGKSRAVFPRHVSGSAVHETRSQSVIAPGLSACGRSVSASGSTETAASSEDLAHSDKGSDEKGGHRGFMGSLRRISLASAHAQQQQRRQDQSPSGQSHSQSSVSVVPPLPPSSLEPSSSIAKVSTSSPVQFGETCSNLQTTTTGSVQVDLASPTSSPPRDWLSSAPARRSGDLPALTHSKSSSFATSSSSGQNAPTSRLSSTSQIASLGRASPLPIGPGTSPNGSANGSSNALRRNSLGDLKIPSRISRAQDGLKRDLGRVREFAGRVEQMQELRSSYLLIASQIQSILDAPRPPSRAASPTGSLFGLSRSNSRARSNTNPPPPPSIDYKGLARGFRAIDTKYSIAWECADLLIELGTGNVAEPSTKPVTTITQTENDTVTGRSKNRERAVTLAGDEGKPDLSLTNGHSPKSPAGGSSPVLASWRATSGKHDSGYRQLYLLREMLNNAESVKDGAQLDIPDVPQWATTDEAMDSSLTLPTDESAVTSPRPSSPAKKKRPSRLVGIRDMLRSLKRSTARALQNQPEGNVMNSSTTISTESSFKNNHPRRMENHPYGYNTVSGIPRHPANPRRKSETSAALVDSINASTPDYEPFGGKVPLTHKSSPRRPSLASLFRIGQKHKSAVSDNSPSADSPAHNSEKSDSIMDISGSVAAPTIVDNHPDTSQDSVYDDIEDSDWDRMDSLSDIDAQVAAIADEASGRGSTMKLRKKKQQNRLSMPPQTGPFMFKHYSLPFSSSQGSVATPDQSVTNVRSPRLSNVDENNVSIPGAERVMPESTQRPRSRGGKDRDRDRPFSSVRAAPKLARGIPSFDATTSAPGDPPPNLKLAMTPENIKPLLENARVVTSRLHDCLAEVKGLLVRTEGSAFTLSTSASTSKVAL
ncbi:uncharacterized protein FOMMEDRAFT_142737 [Fomitiporia mediterranea MF3/22]|uniref:uncharacterized protein n=1 Tax=Fomitiporia mediterranea (strain MF3/22) TaxID=694068 RepID=UPI0004407958|nr:uncharacterized protein FOMMEDRAFT_142737 [Fomitiporia mediterranea MF3/22]EJC99412.1 hypothetical protein FOMMEDRAFT_142737 [Fomitiporia mediterranea MF3/22]